MDTILNWPGFRVCLLALALGWVGPASAAWSEGPAQAGFGAAQQSLEQGRRDFQGAALTRAAAAFEACAADSTLGFDCSMGAARAYLYLTYVRELAGDKSGAKACLDPATHWAQAALKLEPQAARGHSLLADIYGRRILLGNAFTGMRYGPLSAQEVDAAVRLAPADPEVLAALGRRYLYAPALFGGDPTKARDCFVRSLQSGSSDLLLYFLALAQKKLGLSKDAQESLKQALVLNPGNLMVQAALAEKP